MMKRLSIICLVILVSACTTRRVEISNLTDANLTVAEQERLYVSSRTNTKDDRYWLSLPGKMFKFDGSIDMLEKLSVLNLDSIYISFRSCKASKYIVEPKNNNDWEILHNTSSLILIGDEPGVYFAFLSEYNNNDRYFINNRSDMCALIDQSVFWQRKLSNLIKYQPSVPDPSGAE